MASENAGFPKTVVIVPDGNRRKASRIGLPAWRGHEAGYETFKIIFDAIWKYDVEYFVFWALSHDNLVKRSSKEISFLFSLFQKALEGVEEKIASDDREICFHAIGDWKKNFPQTLSRQIESLALKTCGNSKRHFTLLLVYDGKKEIFDAMNKMCQLRSSDVSITETEVKKYLQSGYIPDVDLYIRTGAEGDPHLSSGALMFQMANAQLAFTKTLWPNFTVDEFDKIMLNYKNRERRLGR